MIVAGGIFALVNINEKAETVDQTSAPKVETVKTENPGNPVIKQGEFMDADGFHKGAGVAQVLKTDEIF